MIEAALGDSLEVLKTIEDNFVDAVITDPPYALKFMNKHWDAEVPKVDLWREVLRVLKPGGHLLSFGGTRTYHRMVVAVEDAGFEIRDQIQWIYGSGFPKSHNLKDDWQGFGTALKPANEPIVLARKPLSEKTVADNVLKWGTGALNVDGCRIATDELANKIYRNSGDNLSWGGTYGRGEVRGNAQGRWPANLILDETAAEMLDKQSGMLSKSGGSKGKRNSAQWFGAIKNNGMTLGGRSFRDSGGASRFFYVAKSSKRERNEGCKEFITWESADQNLVAQMEKLNQLVKDTSEDTVRSLKDTEWSTLLFGKDSTVQCQMATKFIILTTIRLTTELKTSNFYQPSNIKEFTRDVIETLTEAGLSLADFVETASPKPGGNRLYFRSRCCQPYNKTA